MAVRQYVGARYVPQFYENSLGTAEWQQGVAYDPLTIVTFNGNSFTSKKSVPAEIGQPNLNPDYWASTGIYNAQIDEYREEAAQALQTAQNAATAAAAAGTAAAAAQTAANTAQTAAGNAQTAAEAAQATAEDAQDDADAILAMIKPQNLRNQDVILIGDSYASGTGATPIKGWAGYFVDMTGCNLVGHAYQNGGGFAAVGNNNADYPNYNYAQCIGAIAASMTEDQRDNVKLIIATSGINDASDTQNPGGTSAVGTGISSFLTAANNQFKNARIVIIPTWNETAIDTARKWNTLVDFIGIAFWWGKCAATSESINWFYGTGVGAGDGIHLSATGYERLAKFIYAFISGWDGKIKGSSQGASNANGVTGTLYCISDGQLAAVHGSLTVASLSTGTVLTTLPARVRPGVTKYLPVMIYGGSGKRGVGLVRITTDGEVDLRDGSAITTGSNIPIYFDLQYMRNSPA